MCYGSTLMCDACHLSTTYVLAGIHRCPTRNTLAHKIIGPTDIASSCWRCRATPATMADPRSEASTVIAWYEKTQTIFGFKDELWEDEKLASELELELSSSVDEATKVGLEQLKKMVDDRVKELEAVEARHRAWVSEHSVPFIVVLPPGIGAPAPLTFQEWDVRFGTKSIGTLESVPWKRLRLDCENYKEYLENNDFEWECDQFHAMALDEFAMSRQVFKFDMVKEGKLTLDAWLKKERLANIKRYHQSLTSRNLESGDNAEFFDFTLNLYWHYLDEPGEDSEFLQWRVMSAKLLRYRLYGIKGLSFAEAEAQIAATPGPKMAGEDEIPMTFAEWCASTLAKADPDVNRYTDGALRADLTAYQQYLHRFPESAPIHEKHHSELQRLHSAYRDDFSSRRSNFVAQGTNTQPLSLKEFSQHREAEGYLRIRSSPGWTSHAYMLYLELVADDAERGGFAMSRDWWARGDRRELEGLPRWDPVNAKIKSVMQWLGRFMSSAEHTLRQYDTRRRSRSVTCQEFLSPHLLMLNACFDRTREPTAEQWEDLRHDVRFIENLIKDLEASRPRGVSDRVMRFPSGHRSSNIRNLRSSVNPTIRFGDPSAYQRSDNYVQFERDDFDRLFDEDHQTVNPPILPYEGPDDDDSSENGQDFDEPLSLFEMLGALQVLGENTEEVE